MIPVLSILAGHFIVWLISHFCLCRAQQQEQREMRVKLQQEVDPGNPSWQFIHMIRYNVQLLYSVVTAPKRRNSIRQVYILISQPSGLVSLPKLHTVLSACTVHIHVLESCLS